MPSKRAEMQIPHKANRCGSSRARLHQDYAVHYHRRIYDFSSKPFSFDVWIFISRNEYCMNLNWLEDMHAALWLVVLQIWSTETKSVQSSLLSKSSILDVYLHTCTYSRRQVKHVESTSRYFAILRHLSTHNTPINIYYFSRHKNKLLMLKSVTWRVA